MEENKKNFDNRIIIAAVIAVAVAAVVIYGIFGGKKSEKIDFSSLAVSSESDESLEQPESLEPVSEQSAEQSAVQSEPSATPTVSKSPPQQPTSAEFSLPDSIINALNTSKSGLFGANVPAPTDYFEGCEIYTVNGLNILYELWSDNSKLPNAVICDCSVLFPEKAGYTAAELKEKLGSCFESDGEDQVDGGYDLIASWNGYGIRFSGADPSYISYVAISKTY